ncbi:MAG: hypothetical protein K8I03_13235 [Ignavibacteria bacterium]|nr:hypothetical protein [Ignavibacteria bacterium]
MKKTFILIILLMYMSINILSQSFVNDTLIKHFEKIPVSDIKEVNGEIWVLSYRALIKISGNRFDYYYLTDSSKGALPDFKDSNNFDVWNSICTNDESVLLCKLSSNAINFLFINNELVSNIIVQRDSMSFPSDIYVDEDNVIWFAAKNKFGSLKYIYFIKDNKLNNFLLPEMLSDKMILRFIYNNGTKYIIFKERNPESSESTLLIIDKNNVSRNLKLSTTAKYNVSNWYPYFDSTGKFYLLSNNGDLYVIDNETKTLRICNDNLGDCFSFVVVKDWVFICYSQTNSEIIVNRINLNNLESEMFKKSNVYNLGIPMTFLLDDSIIGLSGSCSHELMNKLFKFDIH